jgi:hypothetical protein
VRYDDPLCPECPACDWWLDGRTQPDNEVNRRANEHAVGAHGKTWYPVIPKMRRLLAKSPDGQSFVDEAGQFWRHDGRQWQWVTTSELQP